MKVLKWTLVALNALMLVLTLATGGMWWVSLVGLIAGLTISTD